MALKSQDISRMWGGVSQQTPAQRRVDQSEFEKNSLNTVANGNSKRPPSEHVARVVEGQLGEAMVHTINRDLNERYTVVITDGDIRVFDATSGDEKIVGFTNGRDYLRSERPNNGFALITIADFTFVVNKDVVVEEDEDSVTTGSVNRRVQDFNDVTRIDDPFEGQVVEVAGTAGNSFDNYWVRREAGVWRECPRPNIRDAFDASTMPHVLIRTASGDFSFQQADWPKRSAGDNELGSSPFPSFVGQAISDAFFHRNRLGFIAGQNTCMSRSGQFFDFWRSTVTDILDTDPIDVAASHTSVATLRFAVPFDKTLMLMADQTQFVLNAGDILSPNTVGIDVATEYEASSRVAPVGAGSSVYFATVTGKYAAIREYYVEADTTSNTAQDVARHVPRYLPADIFRLAASTNQDMLFALSQSDSKAIYVYQWLWRGNEKAQSSWTRWELAGDVRSMAVLDASLYVLIQYSDGLYLERIGLEDRVAAPGMDFNIMLDRRVQAHGMYDAENDVTSFETPYDASDNELQVVPGHEFEDRRAAVTPIAGRPSSTLVQLKGRWDDGPCFIGVPYEQVYQFSRIYPRTDSGAAIRARLQLQRFIINFSETGFFRLSISRLGGYEQRIDVSPASVDSRTGRIVGRADLTLGEPSVGSGVVDLTTMGNAEHLTLELTNDSHLPSTFVDAAWVGDMILPERL